jgi:hypothetical protein
MPPKPPDNKRGVNRFHERELARAIRAARKSGEQVAAIEVEPAIGLIRVVLGKPGAEASNEQNEWDEAPGSS